MLLEFVYIKCPECGKWYSHTELMSYSVFGNVESWSDGKSINPNMSEYSFLPFAKCDACANFFWFEDCKQLPDYEIHAYLDKKELINATEEDVKDFLTANPNFSLDGNNGLSLDYPPPDYWFNLPEYLIKDLIALLENKAALNEDREIYVRTKLWQHINDLVRDRKNPIVIHFRNIHSFKSAFSFRHLIEYVRFTIQNKKLYKSYKSLLHENLEQLKLLHEKTIDYEDSVIPLIEIERELGNFSKAKALISGIKFNGESRYKLFLKKSKRYINKKSSRIFKIS